ncbi:MAG: 23S rRNA (uracil(1939)-C(5))-methyltransferase RlmD [Pseudomonadota bacterium]|nr:23S rRNA (uracil(1939)-C(5))-methyltransferase RlmD [Pseudomonadota bacterium]
MSRNIIEIADIISSTHDGRGIADLPGKKVFISGALIGEQVTFQRRKKFRKHDEAELLEVIKRSKSRVKPRCEVFTRCGGCSLQHISSEAQRELKQQTLKDSLFRIGKTSPDEWLEPIFISKNDGDWNYRRRARLGVKDVKKKGRVLVGFREKFSPFITDMQRCEVLVKPVNTLIGSLSELIESLSIRSFIPQIEVAAAENFIELVFRVLRSPANEDKESLIAFGKENDLSISLQTGGLDTIEELHTNHSGNLLNYSHDAHNVINEFKSTDFIQINGELNKSMVSKVIELLDLNDHHTVVDLFCGIGNFTLPISRYSKKVIGIEILESLVQRGEHNKRLNQINNVDFLCKDLEKICNSWIGLECNRLLLDPSRNGALEVVNNIEVFNPDKIVYVSCHSGSLARDADILVNNKNYKLLAAGIVDMFPHTSHVESITVFNK